jgi:hypothetical protein
MKRTCTFAMIHRWLGTARAFTILACLVSGSFPALASSAADMPDPADVVRKAIINYQARQLKAREYAYGETDLIVDKLFRGQLRDSELYEVIPLGDRVYRRHLAHNGRPLPPQEEKSEQQRLEQAIDEMEKSFQKRVENPNATVPYDNAPPGSPVYEVIDSPFQSWQFDLASLPEGFSFHISEQVLEGRRLFVAEGQPTEGVRLAERGVLELRNFDIKLWIGEQELELVKFEARARKKGLLATPEHAIVNRQKFQGARAQAELDSLYESTLWYDKGTLITREWTKVNGEVWLPAALHVKGKESHERDYPNGNHSSGTWPMEQQTTYSNYHKFRVTHRILPDFSVKDPAPDH